MKKLSSLAAEGRIFLVKMYYYHHMNVDYVKNAYRMSYEGVEVPSDEAILDTVSLFESTGSIHLSQEIAFQSVEMEEEKHVPVDVKSEPEEEPYSMGNIDIPQEFPIIPDLPLKEENIKEEVITKTPRVRKSRRRRPERQPYICSVCNLSFRLKTHLREHLIRHKVKKSSCPKCNGRYPDLDLHLKTCKGKLPDNLQCPVCGKILKTKSYFRRHSLIHSERNFVCEVCGGRFLNQRALATHSVVHTGEKPYKCDICSKRFTAQATLKTHIRYHTGERPYKCDFCESAFVDRQTMIVHRRQHTGEQPFSCPYENCNRFFKQKQNLRSHLKHIHNVQTKPNAKKPSKYN